MVKFKFFCKVSKTVGRKGGTRRKETKFQAKRKLSETEAVAKNASLYFRRGNQYFKGN